MASERKVVSSSSQNTTGNTNNLNKRIHLVDDEGDDFSFKMVLEMNGFEVEPSPIYKRDEN
jgi:hypothetical protein